MNQNNYFYRTLKDPLWIFGALHHHLLTYFIKDDEKYLKWDYFFAMHKWPNLKNPQTYSEKLQWLKLHAKNENYTQLVDKYEAKLVVGKIIGEKHIIPTLGVWNSFDEINFDELPNHFVLKTTHDSGGVVICKDKAKLDIKAARKKIEKSLQHIFFYEHREYPYKNVRPRIIAEKFMVDESGTELKDYKFFCFDGEVKMLFVATDRPYDTRFDFFDTEFRHLPFKQGHPLATKEIKKPHGFEEMKRIAAILSKDMPHVRVDLYDINGHIYFGELTFFHFSGNMPFEPEEWDYKIGEWLKLPEEKSRKS